jgi:two-component system response regulator PilR (NtrC family)
MESEFFGHTKGSFTGAVVDKEGLFQAAAGGSLFLDEVADLPLSMQVKLLRAIQEKAIRAVGAQAEQAIDVRILCATHKDLAREVTEGRFRQDLFYRLNVIELPMPSLRDRPEDVAELAEQILARISADYQTEVPVIERDALGALTNYDFPGNVRELENILERAFTLCENNRILASDLQLAPALDMNDTLAPAKPSDVTDASIAPVSNVAGSEGSWKLPPGTSLEEYLEGIERVLINDALEAAKWNKTAAAKGLGITFRALRYRLKKLDLE